MYRCCLTTIFVLGLGSLVDGLRGEDKPNLRDALALEQSLQDAIKQAEPSIACILVSRSDAYRKLYRDEPSPDNPGKLGSFEPPMREQPLQQQFGGARFRMRNQPLPEDEAKKFDLADPDHVPEAFGSGVVIDGDKLLVLTNYHVVRDATKIYVRLPGAKGSYADIHAADPRSDLAVLSLDKSKIGPLKAIRFGGGGSIRKGQFVVCLANPFAAGFRDGSPSSSWGIISNMHRRAATSLREEERRSALHQFGSLLQTDVKLNLGCSGGALLNLRGEMIGLTTSRAAISGTETPGGYALPMDAGIQRIIAKLKEGLEVEYGFLGVSAQSKSADGVCIGRPTEGSPASRSLSEGDCIKSINGVRVRDFDDLYLTIGTLLAGSEARLEVQRQSEPIRVPLAKSYVQGKIIVSKKPAPVRGFRVDYSSVLWMMLNPPGGAQWNWRQQGIPPGVYVSEVVKGSPAESKGLRANSDVITHVNGKPVNDPAEFYRVAANIEKATPDADLVLTIWTPERHNRAATTTLSIPKK